MAGPRRHESEQPSPAGGVASIREEFPMMAVTWLRYQPSEAVPDGGTAATTVVVTATLGAAA